MRRSLDEYDRKLLDALRLSHCLELLERNEDDAQSVLDIKVDEATSSVDQNTDKLIQETIFKEMSKIIDRRVSCQES